MTKFQNATAVITGAGSGIGRHLAIELATLGANVAITDINKAALAETAELIRKFDVRVHTQTLDVAQRPSVFSYADTVFNEFGKVNLVVNNAGVGLNSGSFANTSVDEFEWLMSINFSGVMYGSKAFLPFLEKADWGHIVNISSLFGLIGVPGQAAYNASKFAVRGMTEALRQELEISGSTVSCLSVHPGGVKTNIARNARPGQSPIGNSDELFLEDPDQFEKLARTTPESAARQIIKAVESNQRRLLIGADAKLLDWVQRHFPNSYQRLLRWLTRKMLN